MSPARRWLVAGYERNNRYDFVPGTSKLPAMAYPELTHLVWAKHLNARYHLSSSAAPAPPPGVLGLDRKAFPGAKPKDKTPWYLAPVERGDARLEALLGARYAIDPGRVVLVGGASEAHLLLEMLLRGEGGDALCESPGYGPHAGVARAFPGQVLSLRRDAEGRIDRADLDAAASARVRIIVVSDPQNPTGMPLDPADMEALVAWAHSRDAHIVVDEVFREADPMRPPGAWAARWPRVWSVSSLTKGFGLGALRLGWVIVPEGRVDDLRRVQDYTTVHAPAPSIALARNVLERADAARAWVLKALAPNRQRFAKEGGFATQGTTAFVRLAGGGDTTELCAALLEQEGVAVVPGAFFGDPSGFRIGFGTDPKDWKAGWAAVRRTLKARKLRMVR